MHIFELCEETRRKPTQTRGGHLNFSQKDPGPARGWNLVPSCCEASVLTTKPLCCPKILKKTTNKSPLNATVLTTHLFRARKIQVFSLCFTTDTKCFISSIAQKSQTQPIIHVSKSVFDPNIL